MSDDLDKLLNKYMQNPEFKKEYEVLQPEYDMMQAVIDARKESKLTQKQLAEKTGIHQSDISKLENGNSNPTIANLKKLADGMNMTLKIEFVSKEV